MNASPMDRERRVDPFSTAIADVLQLLGRLAIAPIFLLSGIAKITDPQEFVPYIASSGLPLPAVALGMAILIELIGGALIVIGYKTRTVAAILAVFTLATAVVFHTNLSDQTQFALFWKNIAMAGGLMQIVALGAGRWSLDYS